MHVIHTIASMGQHTGGPPHSTAGLCRHLTRCGVGVELITQDTGAWLGEPVRAGNSVSFTLVPCWTWPSRRVALSPGFSAAVQQRVATNRTAIVHDHGVWMQANFAAAQAASRLNLPLIVTPHGLLRARAVEHKRWKKDLAWRLYQRRILDGARVLHATSEEEALDLRRLGLRHPLAVIPNGVDLPEDLPPGGVATSGGRSCAIYVGRLSPTKGLEILLNAWSAVRPPNWQLRIVGPDENGYRATLKARIGALGLQDTVQIDAPIHGPAKWNLFASADLLVMPSFTESFGRSIAEALAVGTPVVTTTGTPWRDAATHDFGWVVEPTVDGLVGALRSATTQDAARLHDMGQRGKKYVTDRFGWTGLAQQMVQVYDWVLGRAERPASVLLD